MAPRFLAVQTARDGSGCVNCDEVPKHVPERTARVLPRASGFAIVGSVESSESALSSYIIWWIMAAVLVGVELATGTFYLLAVGAAFVVGGLAAWVGFEGWVQFAVASIASVVGVSAAHRWRKSRTQPPPMPGLDIGQAVKVIEWRDNGTARVQYRGSYWDAELATPQTPRQESMVIEAMRGSVLVIAAPHQ